MNYLFLLVIFALYPYSTSGLIDGLYCGKDNCYSVLGVERDASKAQIAKVYRQLAKKYHPDVHKTAEAKKAASKTFTLIATAYEVLKDDESRKDYDYMLDNPDTVYNHYYRYYRRRVAPQVDARLVIAVFITIVSIIQYLGAWSRYRTTINHLITIPKYRLKAMEIAKEEKLIPVGKKRDKRTKDEIKEENEEILKKILEERIDIRGGRSKPSITNILWIQLACLPYRTAKYIAWNARWFWKFTINKHEYGEEEKLYFIKKHLQCSETQWDAIPDEEKEECFKHKLWIKRNFETWLEDRQRKAVSEHQYYKRSKR